MKIKVYNLKIKVYLDKNIHSNYALTNIAYLIDSTLLKSEKYTEFHNINKFKNYCFSSLYPLEKDLTYKEGKIYTFILRTVDEDLKEYLISSLKYMNTEKMVVLKVDCNILPRKYIGSIHSITPLFIKYMIPDKNIRGYWNDFGGINLLEERIKTNLIKKYNDYTKENISLEDVEIYNYIEKKNKCPIAVNYSNIKNLCDKVILQIADDSLSQELAYFALGVGIGNMCPRGFGFFSSAE